MAQKRMFDKSIISSDNFLEMPDSSQNLYFHLSMNADDDGFVDNWKSIMRMTGHKEDDLKVLISKSFIIPFQTGVIVIRHWRMNNYLRSDRYTETKHLQEKSQLVVEENQEYTLKNKGKKGLVYQLDTSGITSIEKKRKDNIIHVEQIIAYMNELAGTSFKSTTKKTVSMINARLEEGFTVDEIKDVVYAKYNEWYKKPIKFQNGIMSDKYYRPDTLFGTKFESYLESYKRDYK